MARVCPRCGGSKKVIGLGMMPGECPACHGTGKKKDDTHKNALAAALEAKPVEVAIVDVPAPVVEAVKEPEPVVTLKEEANVKPTDKPEAQVEAPVKAQVKGRAKGKK